MVIGKAVGLMVSWMARAAKGARVAKVARVAGGRRGTDGIGCQEGRVGW